MIRHTFMNLKVGIGEQTYTLRYKISHAISITIYLLIYKRVGNEMKTRDKRM